MPKLMNESSQVTGSMKGFSFSGVRPEHLGATEYTLVTIVSDRTGSVSGFENDILACVRSAVESCGKSPRSENLLLRYVTFAERVTEEHGFKSLSDIDVNDYKAPFCSGGTALFDALYAGVSATNAYAKTLSDAEFGVNGIVFVITDGDDTSSATTPAMVASEIKRGVREEHLESLMTVLIGINANRFASTLASVKNSCELTQYEDAGNATPANLAKLAAFVSRSISSQSQSLGTGGPSAPLTI